jgi:hypothetical protein
MESETEKRNDHMLFLKDDVPSKIREYLKIQKVNYGQ